MAISWSQRKALGKRYTVDPELELERMRLEQEYQLAMPRAQLAEEKRRYNEQLALQKETQKTAAIGDTVSGLGNLYLANKYINAVTPQKALTDSIATAPAITSGVGGTASLSPVTSFATQGGKTALTSALSEATGTGLGGVLSATEVPTGTLGSTPAITSAIQTTTGAGATGMAGSGGSLASTVAPVVAPAGAGLLAGTLAKSGTGKEIGKALLFGGGGRREQAAVAGGVGGAIMGAVAAGAAAGSYIPGIGNVVGAVIGGVVGAVSSLIDSWICTACHRIYGMTKEEIQKVGQLREYCEQHHKKWLDSYIQNAPDLVKKIAESENDLYLFYANIHKKLIDPIRREDDMEKCFEIYLGVVQDLFKEYLPDFEFKEAK